MCTNYLEFKEHVDNSLNTLVEQDDDLKSVFFTSYPTDRLNTAKYSFIQEEASESNVDLPENEEFIPAFKSVFQNREEENIIIKEDLTIKQSFTSKIIDTKSTSNFSSEMDLISQEGKKRFFEIVCPKKILLFTPSKSNSFEGFDFLGLVSKKRIRSKSPRKRLDYDDDTRKKIKRIFFNKALLDALNKKLKNKQYFVKFPQNFVGNVTKEINKEIVNLSIREIFENKEFYKGQKYDNYHHNLKVLESIKKEKNWEMDIILNMKFRDLFEEYINSDEFKINEINRLKKKNKSNVFIERYIYLSKHLIEFFCE